jgi:DNA-binding NarL/FixJ family response regulator
MIRIAVVDDNHLLRNNIVERLSDIFQVIFDTDNATDLLDFLENSLPVRRPEMILMDIEMDEMDGIIATSKVKMKYPDIKVAMLTVFAQEEKVWQSIMSGADGYILKDEPKERLVRSIHDILEGGAYMSPSIARKAMNMLQLHSTVEKDTETISPLTKRELQILEMIAEGLSYNQIADKLFISSATAKTHINHIYTKLQVSNKVQAINKLQGMPRVKSQR